MIYIEEALNELKVLDEFKYIPPETPKEEPKVEEPSKKEQPKKEEPPKTTTSTSATGKPVIGPDPNGNGYIVEIVYDNAKGKLRALGDDGKHGKLWCAFPNHLRENQGDFFRVGALFLSSSGKNYVTKEPIVKL